MGAEGRESMEQGSSMVIDDPATSNAPFAEHVSVNGTAALPENFQSTTYPGLKKKPRVAEVSRSQSSTDEENQVNARQLDCNGDDPQHSKECCPTASDNSDFPEPTQVFQGCDHHAGVPRDTTDGSLDQLPVGPEDCECAIADPALSDHVVVIESTSVDFEKGQIESTTESAPVVGRRSKRVSFAENLSQTVHFEQTAEYSKQPTRCNRLTRCWILILLVGVVIVAVIVGAVVGLAANNGTNASQTSTKNFTPSPAEPLPTGPTLTHDYAPSPSYV